MQPVPQLATCARAVCVLQESAVCVLHKSAACVLSTRAALAFLGLATLLFCAGPLRADERRLEFNRDVRPILLDACLACHGPDSAARKADLRLDRRDAAVEAGAIVPGDSQASSLVSRILSDDAAERMPPPEAKKHLTDEQKSVLARWIDQGAEYQPHWSFIPPARPAVPAVQNPSWPRTTIDRFLLAKLEQASLTPAAEAPLSVLARRACLDLTGLPPTPEQLEQFLNDRTPDAYEKYVDRLLDSPRWGEHRGRYWLDAARYGDTHGIHIDNFREIWAYRDWVIKAFNRNLPFDQFTIENLAGDLLPQATLDQQIASGFNRCNITTSEGGAIDEEYAVLYTRDRTETTSQVWMGLTAGCGVCHDHKFDPLSQREFYAMSAFFNNTTQRPMDGNVKDTPPIIVAPPDDDVARWQELERQVQSAEQAVAGRKQSERPRFDAWLAAANRDEPSGWAPTEGLQLHVPLDDGGDAIGYALAGAKHSAPRPATLQWRAGKRGPHAAYLEGGPALEVAGAGDFAGDAPFSAAAWIKIPANDSGGAIVARMDDEDGFRGWDMWIERRRLGAHIVHRWPDNSVKVLCRDQLPIDEWVHVAIVYDGSRQAAGVKAFVNGKLQRIDVLADGLADTAHTEVPLKVGQRHTGGALSGSSIEDVRVYARALSDGETLSLAKAALFAILLASPPEQRPAADVDAFYDWWLVQHDEPSRELAAKREKLHRERSDIQSRSTIAHVMRERDEAAMAFVLQRGDYDKRLDQVAPSTPAFLPPFPADLPANRWGFAQWLVSPQHPLTARVTVNRFWQELFGQGIVRTAGDFGVSGELPSHPELLDWLAVDFRESGWNVKRLVKQLVMSAAYRQSAATTPEKLERDPENRLISRGPRFRMDAEMVRDYALAASGLLSPRIGGPSVRPYQPPGVWEAVAMIGSDTRDYREDSGESLYRRSMYTFWKRSAPPASMDIFNAPSREHCVMVRERTNTPLQALVTLNDPQFVEAARRLAERTLHESTSVEGRLASMALRLAARELTAEERTVVKATLEKLAAHYQAHAEDARQLIEVGETTPDPSLAPIELAAWTMVANQLMNLDEVLNK